MPTSPYKVLAQFDVPIRGIWRTLPANRLPGDALWDARNVIVRDGRLISRPGLTPWKANAVSERIRHITNYSRADSTRIPISVGLTSINKYTSGAWSNIAGTALTGAVDNIARSATMTIAGVSYILISNGLDTPQQWNGTAGTTSTVSGTPPKWTDLINSFDRIIGILPPNTVRWGNARSITTWPALNFRSVDDTPGQVVAIQNVGSTGIAILKEDCIYAGYAQGGTDARAFAFEPKRMNVAGPANPSAVVNVDGVVYYATRDLRIGRWDGAQFDWIADGVWPIVRTIVSPLFSQRISAAHDPQRHELYFWYAGSDGQMSNCLAVNLPQPEFGLPYHIAWPWSSPWPFTAGCSLIFPDSQLMVFARDDQLYVLDESVHGDASTSFTGYLHTGLTPMPSLAQHRVEALEVFCERGGGYGTAQLKATSSRVLDVVGGTVGTAVNVDLAAIPAADHRGTDTRGRFLGYRLEFDSGDTLRYQGGVIYGHPVDAA